MKFTKSRDVNIPTSSMADIAFLLLIFFLVSTTLLQERGLMMKLPPEPEEQSMIRIHDRNLFKVLINSQNHYLINDEVRQDLTGVKEEVKMFVLNNGKDQKLSENPEKAVVSIKTQRGTHYKYFIDALDEVKGAYYEIYGDNVGLTAEEYRSLNSQYPSQAALIEKGKTGIPMNISIAEPN